MPEEERFWFRQEEEGDLDECAMNCLDDKEDE